MCQGLVRDHDFSRYAATLLSPQTIGPFTRTPYVQLARFALARARVVLARDRQSLDALSKLAPDARGVLAVDVAFALPYENRRAERGGERIRIGVNVSGLLFHEAETGRNRFGLAVDYAQLMRRFIADLVERPEVEVHLVTHAIDASGVVGNRELAEDDDEPLFADAVFEDRRPQRSGGFLSLFGSRPRYDAPAPAPRPTARGGAQPAEAPAPQEHAEGQEDLEIPSFLRRLAN